MEYFLTEQQKTLKSLARRIAEERVLPVRAELDEKEEFPWAIMKDLADSDMFPDAYFFFFHCKTAIVLIRRKPAGEKTNRRTFATISAGKTLTFP